MKNKVVIWGTNAENEKVLIALELKAETNQVVLYTFPEASADSEFVDKMMKEWREGKEVTFPEGHHTLERELSVTDSLLPDDLKVERGDIIQRAQTEWHFAVLSSKLHAAYQQELAEFKEKVEALSTYDNKIWNGLRSFWDKVQGQSRERNLFREHADNLRDNINALFEDMKKLRKQVQNEFNTASQGIFEEFAKALDDVEARIEAGGAKLNSVFDDLKQMQRRYRESRMSNEHRNQLWERLDGAFKKAKERKFGPRANEGSSTERHERRLGGLSEAVKRMEENVRRDEDELNFQRKKVNDSEGQLEAQIRMAKIKMIEERLASKREKLTEMQQTRSEVERQANNAKVKEARRAEKEADKQKIEAAKEAVKSEIAAEIKAKSGTPSPKKEDSLLEAAGTVLGDLLVDALDTAKAVATVAVEKADDMLDEAVQKAEKAIKKAADKAEEVLESFTKDEPPKEEKKDGIIVDDVVHIAGEELESFSSEGDDKGKIIVDDVVHIAGEELESFSSEGDDKGKIIVDDVVHIAGEELESFSSEGDDKGKIIVDDVVHIAGEELESFSSEGDDKGKIIVDDVVHIAGEELESFSSEGDDKGKIIVDDVVHKAGADLESFSSEGDDKGKIIVDDVVHIASADLESFSSEGDDKGKIIVDDVVHKAGEELESFTEEKPTKSKRAKKADT